MNDKNTIVKVEEALKSKNLFAGNADGVMDKKLKKAIKAFQKESNLPPTGKLDQQTLAKLGVEGSTMPASDTMKRNDGTNTNTDVHNQSGTDDGATDDTLDTEPQSGDDTIDDPQPEPVPEQPNDGTTAPN